MATEAQIEANQRNATRSTGPVSLGGKAKSALNALTHGGYARGDIAISRGAFAEDPEELAAMLDAVTKSLRPRDEIEWQQARHIASVFNQRNRVGQFQNHVLAHDSVHEHLDKLEQLAETHELIAATAGFMSDALSDGSSEAGAYPWESFARFTLNEANGGKQLWVKDLWLKDRTPETPEEWKKVTVVLLAHLFEDVDAGAGWVLDLHYEQMDKAAAVRAQVAETATVRILNGLLEKTIRLSGSLGRQITQALDLYRQLAARDLDAGQHHEPSLDAVGHDDEQS